MVAPLPPSPPVLAAAVGAVCLVKRKDDEKSFCGADGGTTHHIHTPRAFLRRWIFRVCACSLVLAVLYLLVALLIATPAAAAALPRSERDVGYTQIRTSRIRRTRNFPTSNNTPLLCCVCKWMWVLTSPEIPILHCDPHSKIPLSTLSRILVLYQGTLVGPPWVEEQTPVSATITHPKCLSSQEWQDRQQENSTENLQCTYVSMLCLFFQIFDEQIIDLLVCRRCRRESSTLEISYWERLLTVWNSGRAFAKGFLASASLSVCLSAFLAARIFWICISIEPARNHIRKEVI